MRALPLLIRLAQTEADERRYELGRIVTAHVAAQAAVTVHDATAAEEDRLAGADLTSRAMHTAWLRVDQRRRHQLVSRQAQLDRAETSAREALCDAVAGLKRLEIVQSEHIRQERRLTMRREAAQADELQTLRMVMKNKAAQG